ncbi:MAG TPA: DUF6298 domain-containing protein [Anaerolineae bacterium]|nr:DUF6298 domain-containing protein [Anaerolineae bacterium]HQI84869.1 DUF6298 domain-containing protein [Anaerolineae bacterium]
MNTVPHFHGPLRTHLDNGRYFTDDSGKAIYLTGSHTWANLQDIGLSGDPPFPYEAYLDFMQAYNHNFMRLWMFEQPERACWTESCLLFAPLPWARTGPGVANDGLPKFDLTVWNPAYFARLRERLVAAGEKGIYAAVMLFQGWSLAVNKKGLDPWVVHPFNAANNVNGVDVPYTGWDDETHPSLHSMHNPQVLQHQEAYVRKVIDTINDLDNVLYEIINEGGSLAWQVHMVDLIHTYERGKPKQHPVGITSGIPWFRNAAIAASSVDWYSPISQPNWWDRPGTPRVEDYQVDPPPADGRKVMVPDTDHLWGHGGNPKWVWKCFARGHNPIFMDPWQSLYLGATEEIAPWSFTGGISKDWRDYPDWEPTRRAMGDTRRYAQKMDLVAMPPRPELSSTRYCLANPGEEYLVYLPEGGSVTLDLCDAQGSFAVEWFLPQVNRTLPGARPLVGGDYGVTTAPYTGDAVLYLKRL